MRIWPLVALLLLLPSVAADPDDAMPIHLQFTDHGEPAEGSLHASHWEGAWLTAEGPLDEAGSVTLALKPGQWILELRSGVPGAPMLGTGFLEVASGLDTVVDLAAREPTVALDVSVVDASTGEPLDDGEAGEIVAQMLFGEPQCIGLRPAPAGDRPSLSGQPASSTSSEPPEPCDLQWAEPGHLVGKVPPGVLTLRVIPREVPCSDTPHEGQNPCWLHVPKSLSLAAVDGEPLSVVIPLLPVQPPDAFVEGYLVSDVTGEAIARKHVGFRGTGEFEAIAFSASVDDDGSYRVGLPAGAYTAWAWVCGHDELVTPFQVATGETLRLDLRLLAAGTRPTPSRTRDPTDTATGNAGPTPTATQGASQTGTSTGATTQQPGGQPADDSYPACDEGSEPDPSEASSEADAEPTTQVVGALAVIDFGGGLGPLEAETESPEPTTLGQAPEGTPGLGPAFLVLALLGLAVRRRLR